MSSPLLQLLHHDSSQIEMKSVTALPGDLQGVEVEYAITGKYFPPEVLKTAVENAVNAGESVLIVGIVSLMVSMMVRSLQWGN